MSNRFKAFLVIMEEDIREDDLGNKILSAIKLIKGVQSVKPVESMPLEDMVARSRVKTEVAKALWDALESV